MTNTKTLVVGAIIVNGTSPDVSILAARRTGPPLLAGRWEFPGGKVQGTETPKAALVREIREELGATIIVGSEVSHQSGAWPISEKYEMRLFFATVIEGLLTPGESHDELCWLTPADLGSINWLPSDADAIRTIQARLPDWNS